MRHLGESERKMKKEKVRFPNTASLARFPLEETPTPTGTERGPLQACDSKASVISREGQEQLKATFIPRVSTTLTASRLFQVWERADRYESDPFWPNSVVQQGGGWGELQGRPGAQGWSTDEGLTG